MKEDKIVVNESVAGQRLDRTVAVLHPGISRSTIQVLIQNGQITVNQKVVRSSCRLSLGDMISLLLPETEEKALTPEDIPLEVLYEDDDLAAINKPAGMVVHPAAGHISGTLVNALLYRWPQISLMEGGERMGIVHRLDKDTSGVILVAKNEAALQVLQMQFKKRTTMKSYIALVEGHPESQRGIIEAPIGRDPRQRKRMAVVSDGKAARTGYQVVETFREHALLHLDLYTGRTHQIRVHLAWLGHPVAGDTVYGFRKKKLLPGRLFLHAYEIAIDLPSSGERVKFTAPLPDDLEIILERFRQSERM